MMKKLKTYDMDADILELSIGKQLDALDTSIADLIEPPLRWQDVTNFLTAVIKLAEQLFPNAGSGDKKKAFAMEVWEHYDEKYHLTEKLDNLIDFKKILGTAIGTVIEQFDSKVIVMIVEKILIPLLVARLFPHS